MSLKDDIARVLKKERISFHMPGHKSKGEFYAALLSLDTTELTGTDNLHSATSCIKEAEERIAELYGAKRSRLMVAGSSIGIIASIYALAEGLDRILIGRDSHKSVFHACKIAGLRYRCVMPKLTKSGIPLDYDGFYEALMEDPELKLALITSPNYYGYLREMREVAAELERRGGRLIVDEAHGAHLNFSPLKAESALAQGAHIVIQSAHKMLPAMTMSALLHYGSGITAEEMGRVDEALKIFQSSSPSYPLMISIDEACRFMDENRALLERRFYEFQAFEKELCGVREEGVRKDPFKIFVETLRYGISGYELSALLQEQGIFVEFAGQNGILLYLSLLNRRTELEELREVLDGLERRSPLPERRIIYPNFDINTNISGNLDTRCEIIDIGASLGRVIMEDITPYPPGIPLLLKGERIGREALDSLLLLSELPYPATEGKKSGWRNIKVKKE